MGAADVTTTNEAMINQDDKKHIDVKSEDSVGNKTMEMKLYELERYYLFEQNNTIDKYELEKAEMLSKHAEEKMSVKRAYEHDKDELLKEIERKDKMLFELTKILKEDYSNKLEKQKEECKNIIDNKERLFANVKAEIKRIVESLTKFFNNNEVNTESVSDFKHFLAEYDVFLTSIADVDSQKESTKQQERATETFLPCCEEETFLSEPRSVLTTLEPTDNKDVTYNKEPLNVKRKQTTHPKVVTRTLSDCIGLKNECCRIHAIGDEAIQHELAQAYRKQKSELLRLFNSEKEEYKHAVNKDKDIFERETRAEYVKRMAVERKAWQETIEDYEREVAILKYERQQMDTNYCVGMDKMKTEFEREKNGIHRRYKESCLQWKKDIEDKMRTAKIEENIESEPNLADGGV